MPEIRKYVILCVRKLKINEENEAFYEWKGSHANPSAKLGVSVCDLVYSNGEPLKTFVQVISVIVLLRFCSAQVLHWCNG